MVAAIGVTSGSASAQFNTWHVDAQVMGGANDGTTWCNAFRDLPLALAVAQQDDEIWIARGTYTPGTLRSDTFTMKR